MATTTQGMTQGFLQSAGGLQTTAQNNVPFSANNGNPYTIYNQTPQQGGYLPPVSNAYDQWRINPMQNQGGIPPNIGGGFPMIRLPNFSGGGGTLPVRPPISGTTIPPPIPNTVPPVITNPNTGGSPNGNMFTIGSGGWMANGPTVLGMGGDNGSLNTSYTNTGFGLFGSGYNGMTSGGTSGTGSFGSGLSNINFGRTGGNILDFFLPGDAVQGGRLNLANLGLGVLDRATGLPLSWGLDKLANTNWAQTSNNPLARWLANWDARNDDAAMQDWYADNGVRSGGGWMTGSENALDTQLTPEQQQAQHDRAMALFNARASGRTAEEILRTEGVAGLVRAGYNPNQINAATGQGSGVNGGMGIGIHASGAFTPSMANVLQGDAARAAFGAMANAQRMQPTYQRHDQQN